MAVNQQQLDYLSAMGIPVWISRDLPLPDVGKNEADVASVQSKLLVELPSDPISLPNQPVRPVLPTKGLIAADELIKDLQQAPVKQIAELAASLDDPIEAEPRIVNKSFDGVDWAALETAVSQCTACDLYEKRQHTVFGSGSQQPALMVVGDIPRLLDEQQKRPFAGEAGELLSNMLSHLGVSTDAIYLTNLLKCRPPLDNSPQPNQAASCLAYLKQEIKLLKPPLVLLMGRSPAQQVLGQSQGMAQLRQKQHQIAGLDTVFVATYHPAYLLKQPRLKALVWQDLQFTKQVLINHG